MGTAALAGALAYAGLVVAAGIPARPEPGLVSAPTDVQGLPAITVVDSGGVAGIDDSSAQTIARDVVVALRAESDALRTRNLERAAAGASGAWLASLWQRIRSSAGRPAVVATYELERMQLRLRRGAYQGPPTVVARIRARWSPRRMRRAAPPSSVSRARAHARSGGRWSSRSSTDATSWSSSAGGGVPSARRARPTTGAPTALGGISLENVADAGRAPLHAGRVPLRRLERPDGDDGRRPLLARLRPRRLARPLRRQLVRADRHRHLGDEGRPSAQRPLPQRRRDVREREPARRRRPPAARGRLRRSGLRPRRLHRPLRDVRGVQRPDGRLRRAALEQRRRDVHRGGARGGDRRARLARRRRGRRRQRRRAARPLRRRVHRPQRPRSLVVGLPDEPPRAPRPPLPQRGAGRERTLDVPRGRQSGRDRAQEGRSRARRRVHGRQRRRTPRPVRRQRRRPEPALRERRLARGRRRGPGAARLPLRGGREAERASTTRTRAWGSPRRTTASTGVRIWSSRTRAGSSTPRTAVDPLRADRRSPTRGRSSRQPSERTRRAGASPGRTSTWTATSTSCSRTAPSRWSTSRRTLSASRCSRTSAGGAPRRGLRPRAAGLRHLARVNGRGLATADYDNDGDLDVAVNSVGGRLQLLRNDGARGHWLEVQLSRVRSRCRRHGHASPTAAGSSARCTPARATSRPRIRACTSASAQPRSWTKLIVRFADGTTRSLRKVAVDRVVNVDAP